jgi:hypothetical protein
MISRVALETNRDCGGREAMEELLKRIAVLESAVREQDSHRRNTEQRLSIWRMTAMGLMLLGLLLLPLQEGWSKGKKKAETPVVVEDQNPAPPVTPVLPPEAAAKPEKEPKPAKPKRGLPALEERLAALEQTIADQQARITGLQTALNNEIAARKFAHEETLTAAKEHADAAIAKVMADVKTYVEPKVDGLATLLQERLAKEMLSRQGADAAFESKLDPVIAKLARFSVQNNGEDIYITGANLHLLNGSGATDKKNGLGNLIIGYNEQLNPMAPKQSGSHNLILGRGNTYTSFGGLVAGLKNEISGPFATVTGGQGNRATGAASLIAGGNGNTTYGNDSVVAGGAGNGAFGDGSVISGGILNTANGEHSTVSGGRYNTAAGANSVVSGGTGNKAQGASSTVSGGRNRTAPSEANWVAGGYSQGQ